MAKTCPACGSPASGRFCSQCGASLTQPRTCADCGNELPPGGRFCNMCGKAEKPAGEGKRKKAGKAADSAPEPVAERPVASGGAVWIGGATAVAAVVILFLVLVNRGSTPPPEAQPIPSAPVASAPGDPSAIDLSSMTPREAADRLFNRVMESVSADDSASARSFAPMAIMAYDRAGDLDLDGLYHVAILHLVNNDPSAALATANQMLEQVPDHLLGLYTAAQATQLMGNAEAALPLYQRFLGSFDAEVAANRPEYQEHARLLPAIRAEAERVVAAARAG